MSRVAAVVLAGVGVSLAAAGCGPISSADEPKPKPKSQFAEDREPVKADATPFDGERAKKYVQQLCDIGPRVSDSEGMAEQQKVLVKHFEGLGGKVTKQEFRAKQKSRPAAVPMTNLIVSWFPDRTDRIILCSHYDTRPQADQDNKLNWNKPFASANDGTSGVAFLMELAHHMKDFPTKVGVDFVLFDGEEYVFTGPDGNDAYFLGSEHFAAEYAKNRDKAKVTYSAAILFDLFAHNGAKLRVEGHSWDNASQLVLDVWTEAEMLKVKAFQFEKGFRRSTHVSDDHLALQAVKIPAIDVIDFDYADWHKTSDTPDKVSAKQMADVAAVITSWLKRRK